MERLASFAILFLTQLTADVARSVLRRIQRLQVVYQASPQHFHLRLYTGPAHRIALAQAYSSLWPLWIPVRGIASDTAALA
jgi:hypothetical protein